jgi:hypothetical protein
VILCVAPIQTALHPLPNALRQLRGHLNRGSGPGRVEQPGGGDSQRLADTDEKVGMDPLLAALNHGQRCPADAELSREILLAELSLLPGHSDSGTQLSVESGLVRHHARQSYTVDVSLRRRFRHVKNTDCHRRHIA